MATSKIKTYQYGNTIRFECKFYDFNSQLINPEVVKIIVYNQKYEQIFSQTLNTNNQNGIGDYYFDYVTDKKEQKLYYEWYGEINGKPSLKREVFITRFI